MNPLELLKIEINFFYIVAGLFLVVSLVGLVFFVMIRFHFKRFNFPHDPKSTLILWWCSFVYAFFLVVGFGTIMLYSAGN